MDALPALPDACGDAIFGVKGYSVVHASVIRRRSCRRARQGHFRPANSPAFGWMVKLNYRRRFQSARAVASTLQSRVK